MQLTNVGIQLNVKYAIKSDIQKGSTEPKTQEWKTAKPAVE